ncbi:hypothetical protein ESY86_08000 [Subsaximicrobium wynnwilliamsii]|uniref:Uncharacterized protein n=1 Tax=Subsaximicrobium wynnwilliamsii TaxID=291179 RepID=A0A5C6ZM13_9FLAO|nr:hypothetical protein [Subsaximicrobium wynnwilliamsii]TXD83974.1 hypothetical protein ESY87_08165 [Subsaximicrobium wynnwilliamsii]TXD89714.1 hypothetical protein ESY86_08000 [Subsaximicrobium wynnwilliamsii]TXE01699.1 hypothetical protein ESY88_15065 [Subsaximicrobium wynnwilliamsii]
MNENTPEQKSEEVDISQIFNLIGKAFKALFDFIVSIFEFILKTILLLALFIRNNIVKLGLAIVVGFVIGFISDRFEKDYYTSTMIVEPNFQANSQLITTIELYGQLVESNDSINLAKMLKISETDAAKISSISIEAKTNENTKIKGYNQFVKQTDTLVLKDVSFEAYKESLEEPDFDQYAITVNSTAYDIYGKIKDNIINIPTTAYVEALKKAEIENLDQMEREINQSLSDIDSLRAAYKTAMLNNSKNNNESGSSNNFYLGPDGQRKNTELELFEIETKYQYRLRDVFESKAQMESTINVVSGFTNIGIKAKNKNLKWYILISLGVMVLFIILANFNRYLSDFERKNKAA